MNLLLQTNTYLIGSDKDVEELAKKEQAKILAVSDSHGRVEVLKKIIEHFSSEIDCLIFCGDGAEDICSIIEQSKKNKKLNKLIPPVVAIVQGNGDENYVPINFNPSPNKQNSNFEFFIPKTINANVAKKNILITHGHTFNINYTLLNLKDKATLDKADIVFFGHTHVAQHLNEHSINFINPGSCSLPRRGLPPSVALITCTSSNSTFCDCTFYKINSSLTKGFSFEPFSPDVIF